MGPSVLQRGPVLYLALRWPENALGRTLRIFRALANTGGDRLWTEKKVSRKTQGETPVS